jgi:hypothetical protein
MIKSLIKEIPSYREFLTVAELHQTDKELAKDHPDVVKLKPIGASKNGFPIQALEIGEGKHQAVAFGFPHPEEPSGSLVLKFLAEKLAEDEELKNRFDYTWHIVKCADPDGAKLNESWFKDFSIKSFALNYYRPPSLKQVEWSFPVKYREHEWRTPIPETQAIMTLINQAKPNLLASLHMAGFGGVYFYVSENHSKLFEQYHKLVESQGLPLHRGEPEVPYRVKLAEAVFKMPVFEDSYDYYLRQLGAVPQELLQRGTSSYGYARDISNPFTLVNEVPFLYNEKAADITPTEVERRESKLDEISRKRSAYQFIRDRFKKVESELDHASPFYEVVSEYLSKSRPALDAETKWVNTDPSMLRKSTEAELFDSTVAVILNELCHYGILIRLANASLTKASEKSTIKRCLTEVEDRFEGVYAEFESKAEYAIIPIQKLVRVQLGSLLYSADYLKGLELDLS